MNAFPPVRPDHYVQRAAHYGARYQGSTARSSIVTAPNPFSPNGLILSHFWDSVRFPDTCMSELFTLYLSPSHSTPYLSIPFTLARCFPLHSMTHSVPTLQALPFQAFSNYHYLPLGDLPCVLSDIYTNMKEKTSGKLSDNSFPPNLFHFLTPTHHHSYPELQSSLPCKCNGQPAGFMKSPSTH